MNFTRKAKATRSLSALDVTAVESEGPPQRSQGPVRRLTARARRPLALLATTVAAVALAGVALAATGYEKSSTAPFGAPSSDGCPSTALAPGEFCAPKRAAVDTDTGDIYVADRDNDRVQVFEPSGNTATYLTEITGLDDPYGIAIDQAASPISIYVSQSGSGGSIAKLDSDGNPTPSFTPDAAFTSPVAGAGAGKIGNFAAPLAIDPASGDLLIADRGDNVVQRHDAGTGAFVSDFDGAGAPDGSFSGLEDIAFDDSGDLLVIDAGPGGASSGQPSRLERYSAAGAHEANLRTLQTEGDGLVAADPHTTNLAVADVRDFSSRIQVLDEADGSRLATISVGSVQLTGLAFDAGTSQRLYAVTDDQPCAGGCGPIGVQVYEPYELPDVVAPPATDVGPTTVTLEGTIDPNGIETAARFDYSTDGGASWNSFGDALPSPVNGTDPVAVSLQATGLNPGTTHLFRLVAIQPDIEVFSATQSFDTVTVTPPAVTLDPVTSFDADTAQLSGTVDPGGADPAFDTTYRFEYATQPDFSEALSTHQQTVTGAGAQTVQADIDHLQAGTEYFVRLRASNSGGEAVSGPPDPTFLTPAAPPIVVTSSASMVSDTGARLNGQVTPRGSQTDYWFEWGPDDCSLATCTSVPVSQDADAGSGHNPVSVNRILTGLEPETVYHFRLVAKNGVGGSVAGEDRTFTTVEIPDPCSNEAIREQQRAEHLPDCRAYEMVSPIDKSHQDVQAGQIFTASPSGEEIIYDSEGAFADAQSAPARSHYVARRGSEGWSTTNISAPQGPSVSLSEGQIWEISSDFTATWTQSTEALTPGAWSSTSYALLGVPSYVRSLESGEYRLVTPAPETGTPPYHSSFSEGDGDFDNVLIETETELTPNAVGVEGSKLYKVNAAGVTLESVLPSGAPAQGTAATGEVPEIAPRSQEPLGAISDDGRTTYFASPNGNFSGLGFGELYRRENGLTVHVNAEENPDLSVPCASPGDCPAVFRGATPDGAKVLFTSRQQLLPEDDNVCPPDDPFLCTDVYLYTHTSSPDTDQNLTLISRDQEPSDGLRPNPFGVVGMSDDGSRIYFTAQGQLVDGEPKGDKVKLYLWEEGEITFITQAPGGSQTEFWSSPDRFASGQAMELTSDGRYLLLRSNAALTPDDNGGAPAAYRYDAVDDELICASCSQDGEMNDGVDIFTQGGVRELADDGRVFFVTPDRLVSRDRNTVRDPYMWEDGILHLLTSGQTSFRSNFAGTSADGEIAFITTREQLALRDRDQLSDLYAVPVGGGFLDPNETRPPGCVDDDCQDPPTGSPESPNPGSVVAGPGNKTKDRTPEGERGKAKKGKKGKKKRKKGKKKTRRANTDSGGSK